MSEPSGSEQPPGKPPDGGEPGAESKPKPTPTPTPTTPPPTAATRPGSAARPASPTTPPPWIPPTSPGSSVTPGRPPRAHPFRRRHIRQTLTFLMLVSIVLVSGVAAYAYWQGRWELPAALRGKPVVPCPTATPTAAPIRGTRVSVYNATQRHGLATSVARDMQKRRFTVPAIGNDPLNAKIKEAAQVRHGPDGLLAARTVAAQVTGKVVLVLDENREGAGVDLVLGAGFTKLRPPPDAAKLLRPSPAPSPSGCVPATSGTTPTPSRSSTPAKPTTSPRSTATKSP